MSIFVPRADNTAPGLPFVSSIGSDLQAVEARLADELMSAVRTAREASSHVLDAGGKRLRPALVILAARACPGEFVTERLIDVAVSAELIHMATLMHDDVIDGADSRRGRATVNAFWGNQASVLTGDYMLANAFCLLARSGSTRILQAIAQAAVTMSEGEIRQLELHGDTGLLTDTYLGVIHDKTAAFMSTCCRVGAMCASASREAEEALAEYGRNLGLAFQITDDLLDLVGDPEVTGKPVGGDVREGKVTLPVMLALRKASSGDRSSVERIISSGSVTVEDVDFVRKVVRDTGSVEETCSAAASHVTLAEDALRVLPESAAVDSLRGLAHYILARDR